VVLINYGDNEEEDVSEAPAAANGGEARVEGPGTPPEQAGPSKENGRAEAAGGTPGGSGVLDGGGAGPMEAEENEGLGLPPELAQAPAGQCDQEAQVGCILKLSPPHRVGSCRSKYGEATKVVQSSLPF
jgi:hypothetical protein